MTGEPAGPTPRDEPGVRGESRYDRVTALLMAVVLGALLVVGWLSLVYMTSQAYASRVTAPLELVEVSGGGGGSPEGQAGSVETIDVPGGAPGDSASTGEIDAAAFEDPAVEFSPPTTLDAAADAGGELAEIDLRPAMATGGAVSSGRRSSRVGTGAPGLGSGFGGGGVGREERWSILYNPGQTLDEYARQLDFLRVELATVAGPSTLVYVSNLSSPRPTTQTRPAQADHRLYFAWQGQGRKATDVALLQKAGIDVGNRPILQFYTKEVEDTLARLEHDHRGLTPAEIRVTRFRVVPRDGGYGFEVLDQQPLR